ncbi:uncharacterized protein I206_100796 [Kwoniella pini CBS 10737]|uniref:Syntaxin n=1 Tax=Kwoniella pini CBS 10737 TaxID=1296096 RepID=A0A1B9ID49_9TREE|nr:uncharacterized protein I206_00531 [Kwoniella pini CBS 10737]OCF53230.1 hypothetical protein I206_00531 [Kwoniella pini CBS 10737]
MSDIQSIKIISTEVIDIPKPHVVYVIQISTPIRTWTVKRRFSDFISLNIELKSTVGKDPPGNLPPKQWSLIKSLTDEQLIRERSLILEQYLILILNSKNSIWRESFGFKDFLSIPSNLKNLKLVVEGEESEINFTIKSWLIEFKNLENLLKKIRSILLKRDSFALYQGNSIDSRKFSIESKKLLNEFKKRLEILEISLNNNFNFLKELSKGEKQRREELIYQLKIEYNNLIKISEIGVKVNNNNDSSSKNSKILQNENSSSSSSTLTTTTTTKTNVGRIFGQKSLSTTPTPLETNETRPLDDENLIQLQNNKMNNQDEQLKELSNLLKKQKQIGQEINQEIQEQNDLLFEIENDIDKTNRKLGKAKRQLNKLG